MKQILVKLGFLAGTIITLWTLYKTVIKDWIKAGYARLMEESNSKIDQIQKDLGYIKKEVRFLSEAQKVNLEENNIMWWRADKNGLTIEVSEQLCRFLQYPPERFMGNNWMNIVPSEEHYNIRELYKDSITYKKDFDTPITFLKGDGSKAVLHVHARDTGDDWFGVHKVILRQAS